MAYRHIFLDGSFIPADQSMIESLSPGHLRARGVFETMRAYDGKVFLLDQHLIRLKKGLKILKIKFPYSDQKLREYIAEFESAGRASLFFRQRRISPWLTVGPCNDTTQNARVRLVIWQDHTKTHVNIVSLPYEPFSQRKYKEGFQAMISKIRSGRSSRGSSVKSLDCLPLLEAYAQAKLKGYDEALLLNEKGDLVEGSRSNIFFVVNGELWTPTLGCGCLQGITRAVVLAVAKDMGIKVKTVKLKSNQIKAAREAFLTNSLIEVMPLTSIDGRTIGTGEAGSLTLQILRKYRAVVRSHFKR